MKDSTVGTNVIIDQDNRNCRTMQIRLGYGQGNRGQIKMLLLMKTLEK